MPVHEAQRSIAPPPAMSRSLSNDAAGKIFASFNTWRFKREQPSHAARIIELIACAQATEAPLHFVLYWGKGPRDAIATPDTQCLDYLDRMARAVTEAHAPGARITLIYTDTHARLNGHAENAIAAYGEGVRNEARKRNFDVVELSAIVADHAASIDRLGPADADESLLHNLEISAAKWYGGPLSTRAAARQYFDQNMRERAAVEKAFRSAIFVTFNNSRLRALFPEHMPVFYMYSLKKGVAVKPWFLDENGNTADYLARTIDASTPPVAAE